MTQTESSPRRWYAYTRFHRHLQDSANALQRTYRRKIPSKRSLHTRKHVRLYHPLRKEIRKGQEQRYLPKASEKQQGKEDLYIFLLILLRSSVKYRTFRAAGNQSGIAFKITGKRFCFGNK